MTTAHIQVSGQAAISARIVVPHVGAWFADVVFAEDPAISGRVTLQIGDRTFAGTVDERAAGSWHVQRSVRIVAGAGSWGRSLPAKAYHADNGVRSLLVAQDAAREAGETLAEFPTAPTLGADYVRTSGPASRVLEAAADGVPWWVDYAGATHVAERASATAPRTAYEVLDYDPVSRLVTLGAEDVGGVGVGSVLSQGLDQPQTIRELEIVAEADAVRLRAWCGPAPAVGGRATRALVAIVEHVIGRHIYGKRLYRLVSMTGDRCDLQAVERSAGLPDLKSIAMWPGVAGMHATLSPGAEVLVEFVDGDRARPIITGYVGKGGPGFIPTRIDIGDTPTSYLALADLVKTELDAMRTWANTHTHTGVTTGAGTSGAPSTPKAATGNVASSLVRST